MDLETVQITFTNVSHVPLLSNLHALASGTGLLTQNICAFMLKCFKFFILGVNTSRSDWIIVCVRILY